MKKTVVILVMFLIAATTFSQSENRTSNREKSAQRNTPARTESSKGQTSTRQKSSNTENQNREARKVSSPQREATVKTQTPQRETTTRTQAPQREPGSRTKTTDKDRNTQNTQDRKTTQHRDDRHHANTPRETHRNDNKAPMRHAAHTEPVHNYASPREYREKHEVRHYYHRPPESRSYRSIHYVYRAPVNYRVVWTPVMYRRYLEIYPMIKVWYYPVGYSIETISAYDALYYKGEVMNVYGRVNEVFYSRSTDEYFLYFGPYYPYQDFTVVIPGRVARAFSPQPMRYFENQNIITTGLITEFEDIPEIVIRDFNQVQMY